jgi:thiol-disulfide isomerase/thioredoxin
MSHLPAPRCVVAAVAAACLWAPCRDVAAADPAAANATAPAADPDGTPEAGDDEQEPRGARVPPVPDGSPAEILRYVARVSDPAAIPRSRGRRRYYLKKAGAALVEAADKLLAQVAADDPLHAEAVRIKLDGFSLLDEMGDKEAVAAMAAFARTLVDHPDPAIARQARRMTIAGDVDALYQARSADGAGDLIDRAEALLAAGDDPATARVAAQLAEDLAGLPGADAVAKRAHETFIPLFEKSADPQVQRLAEKLAGGLRRLALLGQPLPVSGKLLDDTPFDPALLSGKVVLVDFWATWCGPCVAEIPAIRAHYDKYHAAGFEVVGVSLDDDPAALREFVAEKEIPWPVILDSRDPRASLADRYGIKAIPAMFLVGRDGKVVSVRARGEALAALLAEQFPDVR